MSENPKKETQRSEEEQARLRENLRKFEQFKAVCDIRLESGQKWYQHEFTDRIDYKGSFNYLSTHFDEGNTPFTNALFHIVRAQLLFQKKLATLEQRIDARSSTLDISEESLGSFESSYRALKTLQNRYHVKKRAVRTNGHSAYASQDEEDARHREKVDAIKAFSETAAYARRFPSTPWPTDPDLLKSHVQQEVKLQPEHSAPSSAEVKKEEKEAAAPETNDALTENYDAFVALQEQFDIRTNGYKWYVEHLGESIDFSKVFRYLQFNKINGGAQSNDALLPLIKVQILLQDLVDSVERKHKDAGGEKEVSEIDFTLVNELTRKIAEYQRNFEASGNRDNSRNDFLSIQDEARDFVEPEVQLNTDEVDGGEDSGSEFKSEVPPVFEFNSEFLQTSEGRTQIFREMVRMYNAVRNKRDMLGFEGRKNVKNADFDGYLSFRRMYVKLKKLIAEFSNRGETKDAEGKTLSYPVVTVISDEERSQFEKDFAFLKSYYARTKSDEESKTEPTPEPEAASPTEPTPEPAPSPEPQPVPPPIPDPIPQPEPNLDPTPEPATQPQREKEYEERLAIRAQWKEKKAAYENDYETFLTEARERKHNESVFQKMAFWRKENIPESVTRLQTEYEEARREYASSLNAALLGRIGKIAQAPGSMYSSEEKIEGLRAGLANRFVLKAAHDKLALEKQFVPEGRSLRVFSDLQKSLKKHRKLIKAAGYLTVAGVALASGGIGAAVIALGSKTLQTKVSAVLTAAGATGGAYLGNRISDTVIDIREKRRNTAAQNAQYSFSIEHMNALENTYLKKYRSHESAVRNKKYIVGATAVAGGILGAMAAQNFHDVTNILQTPAIPHVPPVVPHIGTPEVSTEPLLSHEQLEQQLDVPPDNVSPSTEAIPEVPIAPPDVEHSMANPVVHEHSILEHHTQANPQVFPEAVHDVPYTFKPGSKVDTVSEALFESWKQDPSLLESGITKKEFLAQMYGAMSQIEKSPSLNHDLLQQMGVTSGDLDKVQVGQTINLQPFFEYLKTKH